MRPYRFFLLFVVPLELSLQAVLTHSGARAATYAWTTPEGERCSGSWGSFRSEKKRKETQENHLFDLASLTKLFTTTLVLKLWECGQLDISAPVQKYLPDFQRGDVTLHHLLTHTARLSVFLSQIRVHSPTMRALRQGIMTAGRAQETYVYQDPNMILLGWIAENVTGLPLDVLFRREIFGPLGMEETFLGQVSAGHAVPTRAGTPGVVHDATARIFGGTTGHAGLFSTARDLLTFVRSWREGGAPLLAPQTVQLALTPYLRLGDFAQAYGWKISSPRAEVETFLSDAYMHGGFTGTFACFCPVRGMDLVILTDFVYPGERTPEERAQWWNAMRRCTRLVAGEAQ